MNATDFTVKTSTVVSVQPTNSGSEIWVQYDDGRETSYQVNDDSFRAREGHKLTAVLYGRHPVALRNETTMTKSQLLNGQDLLGTGPLVEPKPASFWVGWFFLISCPGFAFVSVLASITDSLFSKLPGLQVVGGTVCVATYLAMIFGIPYWCIIRPRLLRAKHQRQIKAADAAISEIFNPL